MALDFKVQEAQEPLDTYKKIKVKLSGKTKIDNNS